MEREWEVWSEFRHEETVDGAAAGRIRRGLHSHGGVWRKKGWGEGEEGAREVDGVGVGVRTPISVESWLIPCPSGPG